MKKFAGTMRMLIHELGYDFFDHGYDFKMSRPFSKLDIYRQPDPIGAYAYQMIFAARDFDM